MPRARRLLFIVNNPSFFASHRLAIAEGAMARGYEVFLACPEGKGIAHFESLGIRHRSLSLERSSMDPRDELGTLWAIRRILREIRPDVLHAITLKPVLYGGLVARMERVPLVVSAISGLGYTFIARGAKAKAVRAGLLAGVRLALGSRRQRVIFQNPADRAVLVEPGIVSPARVRMIKGSGTRLEDFGPLELPEALPPTVLLPARMLWDKGVAEFVEAADILHARKVPVRMVLSGDPDEGNPSSVERARLEAWNDAGTVDWLPHTNDIASRLAESHLVVLPSYREGFPKSLIDASAAGRACVTTDVPGCRDAIVDGETGLLVPVRNGAALADAIETLVRDPALMRRMGQAARRLAEREYAIEKVVDAHLAIYDEAFAQSRS